MVCSAKHIGGSSPVTFIQWSSWPGRLTQAFSRPSPHKPFLIPNPTPISPFRPNQCSLRKRGHPFQLPIINTGHPFKINFHQQVPLSVCVILSLPPHFRLRGPSRSAARQAWCGRLAASYFKLLHPSCFIFQFGPRSAYFHMLLLLCFLFYV